MKRWSALYCWLAVLIVLCIVSPLTAQQKAPQEQKHETQLSAGIQLFEHEQWAEARRFFSAVAAKEPENALARFYLGRITFAEGQYDAAAKWFEQAVDLEKKNADFHLWLGRAYGYQAQSAFVWRQLFLARKVRQHFEQAVALDPDHVAARWDLMEYYLRAPGFLGGSWDEAKTQAREIEQRDAREGKEAWRLIAELGGES